MVDVLVALRFASPLPRGRGVALAGAGGGPSFLASDEIEKAGLELPRLSSEVQAEMMEHLPVAGSGFSNPVDTPNLATPDAIAAALRILGRAPEIDMILYHLGFHPISRWGFGRFSSEAFLEPLIASIAEVRKASGKPVLMALRPPLEPEGVTEFLATQAALVREGTPVFHSLRAAAKAMSRVVPWGQARFPS
jgi:acyl-CoA synthetase (NDP forming)